MQSAPAHRAGHLVPGYEAGQLDHALQAVGALTSSSTRDRSGPSP